MVFGPGRKWQIKESYSGWWVTIDFLKLAIVYITDFLTSTRSKVSSGSFVVSRASILYTYEGASTRYSFVGNSTLADLITTRIKHFLGRSDYKLLYTITLLFVVRKIRLVPLHAELNSGNLGIVKSVLSWIIHVILTV